MPDFFTLLCRMKRAKEIQTQVSKKVFCKDYICNDILTVVKEDYALTTDPFAAWDFANYIFLRELSKSVESLHQCIKSPVQPPPGDPFPEPLMIHSAGPPSVREVFDSLLIFIIKTFHWKLFILGTEVRGICRTFSSLL